VVDGPLSVDAAPLDGSSVDVKLVPPDGAADVTRLYVAVYGDDEVGLGTQASPWRTISYALSQRTTEDEIVVGAGLYDECIELNQDHEGLALLGTDQPTIDGLGCAHVVRLKTGLTSATRFAGFTVINGDTNEKGGGILVEASSSPTIEYNIVRNNHAHFGGGGIYLEDGSQAVVRRNIIANNTSAYDGAGIGVGPSSPQIVGNTIEDNTNGQYVGGGINCDHCTATIAHNIIRGNQTGASAVGYGGGIGVDEGSPEIFNNLIIDNTATAYFGGGNEGGYGGGIHVRGFIDAANPSILDNTIVNNAADFGGGIAIGTADSLYSDASPILKSNIIAFNRKGESGSGGEGIYVGNSATYQPIIDFNAFWSNPGGKFGGWVLNYATVGPNNIEADPLFVSGADGDYYLSHEGAGQSATSPCADAGHVSAAAAGLDGASTQTDGTLDTGTVDIGYHYGAVAFP